MSVDLLFCVYCFDRFLIFMNKLVCLDDLEKDNLIKYYDIKQRNEVMLFFFKRVNIFKEFGDFVRKFNREVDLLYRKRVNYYGC